MPKKQTQWTRAYNERAYARISVTVPKAREAEIKAYASSHGETLNGIINRLLRQEMGLSEEEWKRPGD